MNLFRKLFFFILAAVLLMIIPIAFMVTANGF